MKSIRNVLPRTIKQLLPNNSIKVFCAGFIIGLIASWAYILADGDYWVFIPLWAEIIFYPGFLAGNFCYNLFSNMNLALWAGTLTVGLFYGIVLVVMHSLWIFFRRKNAKGRAIK
ncbi:MAG: hypothetical protein DRP56_00730 [Planctomycetota bacterium]|nr:MAG: hypothetical protein DRP56_00730 [Planctomycetota bacterium]